MPDYGTEDLCWFEEISMIRSLDEYLDQDAQAVYFRANDIHGNWRRTANVIEPGFLNNGVNKLYHVNKVGIIEEDYEGNTILAEFCTVPVQNRFNGAYVLDYAAQVLATNAAPPPEYIWSQVTSPSDEGTFGPEVILVPLYRVDPSSQRYDDLNSIFGVISGSCDVHYYSRGTHLVIPPEQCPKVVVFDMLMSQAPHDKNDYGTQPILYVTDRDDMLPPIERKDYSIASCGILGEQSDFEEWLIYQPALDAIYYGENRYIRGRFLMGCEFLNENDKQNCASDVLKCGVERVQIDVEGHIRDIGVQSRGDVYFVLTHGVSPDHGSRRYNPDKSIHWAMGKFLDCGIQGGNIISDDIWVHSAAANPPPPYHWDGSGLDSPEIKWLISDACSILNDPSYPAWKNLIQYEQLRGNGLMSISAFKSGNKYRYLPGMKLNNNPSQFFSTLSYRLSNCNGQSMDPSLWAFPAQIPVGDDGIIAWMENACWWANEQKRIKDKMTVQDCASINSDNRFVLDEFSISPRRKTWKITIKN